MTAAEEGAAVNPSLALLADHAGRAIARQAARVDEHRTRAATLFTAASIAGAFLGAEAFKVKGGPGAWAWVGAVLFVVTGCILAYVMWPRNWAFTMDVRCALDRVKAENLSVDQTNEAVITGLWENYEQNEPRLDVITKALAAMGLLVVGEILALFVNLAVR
jgi:hypothetical protein